MIYKHLPPKQACHCGMSSGGGDLGAFGIPIGAYILFASLGVFDNL